MRKNNRFVIRSLTCLFVFAFFFFSNYVFGENNNNPWLTLLLSTRKSAETHEVGVEGGIIKFSNGVILDIPAGAVTETTSITVKEVLCGKVDPILSDPQFASHEKRCIGGFIAEPDGLQFDTPIKATIPVLPFDPGEFPVQIEVDYNSQKYWITETDLIVRQNQGVIEITLDHFSGYWLAVLYKHIDTVCGHCGTWDDPEFMPICENLDLLQPNCCLLYPAERGKCAPQCKCCREELMIVRASGMDFSNNDCQILGDDVEVTFPKCQNSPTESYNISEISDGCPEDIEFEVKIDPSSLTLYGCQKQKLTASITGKSKDGKTVYFSDSPLYPTWEISNSSVAVISQNGTVTGTSEGTATVKAVVSENSKIPPGEAQITVTSDCGISGLWHLTPISQSELCRDGTGEWWQADPFSSFNVRFSQPLGLDSDFIMAYRTDTKAILTGTWNFNTGEFTLSTNTSDIGKCGYLFYNSDICGDAIDCQLESCQDTTDISGSTSSDVTAMDAQSTWYYFVTFSYEQGGDLPRGENTWECKGSATVNGSRP